MVIIAEFDNNEITIFWSKMVIFGRKWSFLFEISIFDQECINIT